MKKEYDVETRWTAYPLSPKIPEGGVSIVERFAASGANVEKMNERMQGIAAEAGLLMAPREMSYNSRSAHELSKWAAIKGKEDEFHAAIFRAFFGEAKNISDISILADIADAIGLSGAEAREVLESRSFQDPVDADWSRSMEIDPEYIPSLMLNDDLLVNPQQYELFEVFLDKHQVKKKV